MVPLARLHSSAWNREQQKTTQTLYDLLGWQTPFMLLLVWEGENYMSIGLINAVARGFLAANHIGFVQLTKVHLLLFVLATAKEKIGCYIQLATLNDDASSSIIYHKNGDSIE